MRRALSDLRRREKVVAQIDPLWHVLCSFVAGARSPSPSATSQVSAFISMISTCFVRCANRDTKAAPVTTSQAGRKKVCRPKRNRTILFMPQLGGNLFEPAH